MIPEWLNDLNLCRGDSNKLELAAVAGYAIEVGEVE